MTLSLKIVKSQVAYRSQSMIGSIWKTGTLPADETLIH